LFKNVTCNEDDGGCGGCCRSRHCPENFQGGSREYDVVGGEELLLLLLLLLLLPPDLSSYCTDVLPPPLQLAMP
jgi:hypothetical protein